MEFKTGKQESEDLMEEARWWELYHNQWIVGLRKIQTCKKIFRRFYLSQTDNSCCGARSKMFQRMTVCSYFYALEIKGGNLRTITSR